jgi:hypothetical protein
VHEDVVSSGVHLHGLYNINKLGYGLGFESVFADVIHNNVSVILAYRLIEQFELSIAPGVLLENEETNKNYPTLHFEGIYLFEMGKIGHFGPVISYSYASVDQHYLFGIHFGFDL